MRFCNKMRPAVNMGIYSGDVFRREIVKAIKDGHIYGIPIKKSKRFRSAFTTEQVNYLEKEFRKYPYIGNARRKDVSNALDIPERAVKIWFQNRRMKEKKDASSKCDGDKCMEIIETYNNECSTCTSQSTTDSSLPPLETSAAGCEEVKLKTTSESKQAYRNYFKDLSIRDDELSESKREPATVVKSSTSSLTATAADVSFGFIKQYKTEENAMKDKLPADPFSDHHMSHTSHIRHLSYPGGHQNWSYPFYLTPPSNTPQDLSSKSEAQLQKAESKQISPGINYNPPESPFYLKGYFTQPYIPPGSTIWKPLNITPLVTSAPISALPIPAPETSAQNSNTTKGECNCVCHKPQAPITTTVQNNPSPSVHYVITAVPFATPSPKY